MYVETVSNLCQEQTITVLGNIPTEALFWHGMCLITHKRPLHSDLIWHANSLVSRMIVSWPQTRLIVQFDSELDTEAHCF